MLQFEDKYISRDVLTFNLAPRNATSACLCTASHCVSLVLHTTGIFAGLLLLYVFCLVSFSQRICCHKALPKRLLGEGISNAETDAMIDAFLLP